MITKCALATEIMALLFPEVGKPQKRQVLKEKSWKLLWIYV